MKLNGWIRLWVVVSVCWLALVSYFAYNELSSLYTKKNYEVAKAEIGKVEFIFSAAQSDAKIKELIANELIPLVEKSPQDYVNKVVSAPYEKYLEKHASTESAKYIKIALFPIFSLLALGWSFVWVRRGFRRDTLESSYSRSASRFASLAVPVVLYVGVIWCAYVQAPTDWIVLQTWAVVLTGVVVIWYAWETRELRIASYVQIESQIRPYVVLQPQNGSFLITNFGNGVALHIRLDPVTVSCENQIEIRFLKLTPVLRSGESISLEARSYKAGQDAGDYFNDHIDPKYAKQELAVTLHFDDVELKSYSITQRVSHDNVIVVKGA